MAALNQIQLRRGTATSWQTTNPTLTAGEPGFVTDINRLKIGDGTTPWNDLDYISSESYSLVTTVFNNTGSLIPKMTAVYINGGQGDQPTVALAIATSDPTSAGTYGVTAEAISNMSTGKVIVFGSLINLNTDQFNPTAPTGNVNGSTLYLSPTVAGGLTRTKPSAPNHIVAIGTIIRTHQNEGIIEVRVQNGFELDELHNVAIIGVTGGQFLYYDGSTSLWKHNPNIYSSGSNIGIGTSSPGSTLDVKGAGTTDATSSLNVSNSSNTSLLFVRNDGNIGINNTSPASRLVIKGTSNTSATSALNVTNSSNTSLLFVQNDGKVGVGTVTPTQKLDVVGTIAASQVTIGTDNTLDTSATHANIIGGLQSKASMYGEIAHAAGGFGGINGTAQHRILVARALTISGAFTVTIGSPAIFTRNGHSLSVGDTVKLSTTGALPTGLNTTATYYVISSGLTSNTFQLSTSAGGSAINTSGTQSGIHTLVPTTSMTLNGALGLQTPALMVIPERSTWAYNIKISAYNSQDNQGGAWWFVGGLRRNLTTTIELENTQGFSYLEGSFNPPTSLISINADTINNALDIQVGGILNKSVRWAAVIDIIQVSYGTP